MEKVPISAKLIILILLTAGVFASIFWVVSAPEDYEPWASLFGSLAGWIADFVILFKDLSELGLIPSRFKLNKLHKVKTERKSEEQRTESVQRTKSTNVEVVEPHHSALEPFYYIAIVLVSGGSGITSIALLALDSSETIFYTLLMPAIVGSVALTLFVDAWFHMQEHHIWKRVILAIILGVMGAFLGLLITAIVIIFAIVHFDSELSYPKRQSGMKSDPVNSNINSTIHQPPIEKTAISRKAWDLVNESVPSERPNSRKQNMNISSDPINFNAIPGINQPSEKKTGLWHQFLYGIEQEDDDK